ncbi:MAG: helix-turn-helix domain-containing protein [Oscillospiraceae bacterium]|nr:helix-turn-helix domain-containing protein [Oscillospiraceae bacterium]
MNCNILGEQIAKFRKAMGMTQEDLGRAVGISAQAVSRWECGGAPDVTLLPSLADTLGVTVDALFGREGGEKVNIEDAVRRWMLTVPQGQRVDRLCRLVWAAAGPLMSSKPDDQPDISGYETCCETESVKDGKTVRWLRRTRIMTEDGIILGVRASDMSFAAIFPEPEAGWEPFLADNGSCRRLFAALARPHCLELLEYLHSKPSPAHSLRRYTPGAIAKPMGLETTEAEALMDALAELNVLSKAELETEDGIIHSYLLGEDEALVPFLYFARWLTTDGSGYLNAPYRRSPMLRGEKWKETEKTED